MKKKYVFFDFDGTLVNTSKGIFHSLEYAFSKMGEPILDEEQMRKYIGPPLDWSFMTYNNMSQEDAKITTEHFRDDYRETGGMMHEVYSGVKEMLKNLKEKGKILAVATSKPEVHAIKIMKKQGLFEYFDVISGATFDDKRKSKKDVLLHAIDLAKPSDMADCVLVGDTKSDAHGAVEVGMDCIGILYGFGSEKELLDAGATLVVGTPSEVVDIIE